MNSIMEWWDRQLPPGTADRTLVWTQRHLMTVLREYEDFYNTHRPHRALKQAAPLRRLPGNVTDLDRFRVQRRDRAGGVIHDIAWWHRFSAPTGRARPRGAAQLRVF